MTRLINAFEQMLDGSGDPVPSGLIDFFESGSSSARKTTFADSAQTIPNANPVVLGGDGRCPNVFGTGSYNAILRNAAGVQILARDPVGQGGGLTFGDDWSSTREYSSTDQVRDAATYWQSLVSGNLGNQPSLDSGAKWVKTDFTKIIVNTNAITTLDSTKISKTGGAFTGQVTSTSGDFNLVTNTALSNAAATLTAAQLIGGEFTITPTVARIQTLDTAANIISALSGSVDNSNFTFTIVNLAPYDVTIATAAGVTLVGNMIVNDGSATFRVRRLNSSTVSVTRLDNVSTSAIELQSSVATTSGTSIDLTGVPAGVKRLTVIFNEVSVNAASRMIVQLGDSGGVETSGYAGSAWTSNTTNSVYSNGFIVISNTTTSYKFTGAIVFNLQNISAFTWNASGVGGFSGTSGGTTTGGAKSLSSELTQLRLTSESGSAVFDSGSITISWEF
jgi:hypothetical protein